MYQYQCTNCDKYTLLMQNVNNRRTLVGRKGIRVCESVLLD